MAADAGTQVQAAPAAELMAGLSELDREVAAKVLRVLTDAGTPLRTRQIEAATGYGQLCYRMLCRLARRGALVKITLPDVRSPYWQLPGASPQPPGGRKAHAHRDNPPWRTAHDLTACGLEVTDIDTVLPWAAFDQMVQAEEATETPLLGKPCLRQMRSRGPAASRGQPTRPW